MRTKASSRSAERGEGKNESRCEARGDEIQCKWVRNGVFEGAIGGKDLCNAEVTSLAEREQLRDLEGSENGLSVNLQQVKNDIKTMFLIPFVVSGS